MDLPRGSDPSYCYSGDYPTRGPSFNIKLHSETQISGRLGVHPLDMPRTPYRASEGKRSQ